MVVDREQARGIASHRAFWCRAPLGFQCHVLAGLEQVLGLYDIHVFKLLSKLQARRIFLLKQHLFFCIRIATQATDRAVCRPLLATSLYS